MRVSIVIRALVLPILAIVALVALSRSDQMPYATLAMLGVASALLVDLATLTGGVLQNVLIVAATTACGLTAIEAVAEARMPHVAFASRLPLWAPDDVMGYHAERPGIVSAEKTVEGLLSYRVSYTIDDDLRRLTRSAADGPKVRFLGDSYTFGEGLDDADTLPQRFADMTGANVLNYGYPGYSPAQALRALQLGLYDNDLAKAKVIVLQTGPFHVARIACKPAFTRGFPRYVVIGGKLELKGRCDPTPGQTTGIYKMLLEGLDQKIGRADVDTYIDVVDAFIDLARRKYHAVVVVMDMIRNPADLQGTGVTSGQIESRFREHGAIVIDNSVPSAPKVSLTLPYDEHPSAAADRLYARKLVETIDRAQPGILSRAAQDARAQAEP